jgi:hypothetical protein
MKNFIKKAVCALVTVCYCNTLVPEFDTPEFDIVRAITGGSDVATPEQLQEILAIFETKFQKYLNRSGLTAKEKKQLAEFKNSLDTSLIEANKQVNISNERIAEYFSKKRNKLTGKRTMDTGEGHGGATDLGQGNRDYERLRHEAALWQTKFNDTLAGEMKIIEGELEDPRLVGLELKAFMAKAAQQEGGVRGTLSSTGLSEKQQKGESVPMELQRIGKISPTLRTPEEQEAGWLESGVPNTVEDRVKYIDTLANNFIKMQQNEDKSKTIQNIAIINGVAEDIVTLLTQYQGRKMSPHSKKLLDATIAYFTSNANKLLTGENLVMTYELVQPSAPVIISSKPFGASGGQEAKPAWATPQLRKTGERQLAATAPVSAPRAQVERATPVMQPRPAPMPQAQTAPRSNVMPEIAKKTLVISPTENTVEQQNTAWNKLGIRFDMQGRAKYVKDLANELLRGQKNARTRINDEILYDAVASDLIQLLNQYSEEPTVTRNSTLLNQIIRVMEDIHTYNMSR